MIMQWTLFAAEPPAKTSQSPDSVKDWLEFVAISCLPLVKLLHDIGPAGWYGKTSPVSFQATREETLQHFWDLSAAKKFKCLTEVGAAPASSPAIKTHTDSPIECLTLNISEWPKDAAVCSLSDILETGALPPRFFLSAKACAG